MVLGLGNIFRRGFGEKTPAPRNLYGSEMKHHRARHAMRVREREGEREVAEAMGGGTNDEGGEVGEEDFFILSC